MRRSVFLVLGVLGLAVLLWWATGANDTPTAPPAEPPPAPERDGSVDSGPLPPEATPPSDASLPESPNAGSGPGTHRPESDVGLTIPVRVTYLGGDEEPAAVRIVFEPLVEGAERVEVSGRGGRLLAGFPGPGRYRIESLVVDGERHDPTWREITVAEGEEIALRIARTKSVVLVVTDALTGALLPEARAWTGVGVWGSTEVVRHGAWRGRVVHAIPRREGDVVEADAAARIPLDPERWTSVAVIAPGHAWTIVEVPRSAGGELTVELLPGGGLTVRIPRWGEIDAPDLRIELEGPAGDLQLREGGELRQGGARICGLLAGRHELLVREGGYGGKVIGRAEVVVNPGQVTEAVIDVEPSPGPRAEVSGRIHVPEAWRESPRFLIFQERLGPYAVGRPKMASMEREEAGGYRYRVQRLTPGTYFVEIQPFEFRRAVEIGPGAVSIDFDLPEPVEVRIRVLGADTGRDLPGADVGWHSVLEGLGSYGIRDATRGTDGWFAFQAPPGRISVSGEAEGYLEAEESLEVRGSRFEREIHLAPGCILLVRFRENGEVFSGDGLWCDLEGNGVQGRRGDPEGVRYPDLAPGEYTLSVKEVPGFEPVPKKKIVLRPGMNEAFVDLVRKR